MPTYMNNPHYFLNMDETAIYRNCSSKRTVHAKGKRTVSIMLVGTSVMRFTLAISVDLDGTKLPLFDVFKDISRGSIDRQLPFMLPAGIVRYFQVKIWTDDRTM